MRSAQAVVDVEVLDRRAVERLLDERLAPGVPRRVILAARGSRSLSKKSGDVRRV